jgi:hypothetical protein
MIPSKSGDPPSDNTKDLQSATASRPRLRSVSAENGTLTLEGGEAEHAMIAQAFGGDCGDFQGYCLRQLINILPEKEETDFTLATNAALAMLSAIDPHDEFEASIAIQIVCAHHAAVTMTRRCLRTDRVDFLNTYGNMANKFSRTHAALVEALNRHRRGGKQIVEHVHVNNGGQAVIAGIVNNGGRG